MFEIGVDMKELKQSFAKAVEELYAVDWSETDGKDVENILNENLKDGIAAHKDFWMVLLYSGEFVFNMFQKVIISNIISRY